MSMNDGPQFVTLGMFIIDEFDFKDADGKPTGKTLKPQERNFIYVLFLAEETEMFVGLQIGGGGTYAIVGARMWLTPNKIGMVVDKGYDFPKEIREQLLSYGDAMWMFREQPHSTTTRALNMYYGDHRDFKYLTERIRITPRDINGTKLGRPHSLHFICSPTRAKQIVKEIKEVNGWNPIVIYEPIPDSCVPEELPALKEILQYVDIFSPNAEEGLSLLDMSLPPTKASIEKATRKFLDFGVGGGGGTVIIRSGSLGAYVKSRGKNGAWIDAYWTESEEDAKHVVDVTGCGNSFLGGVAAGLTYTHGDAYEATFFGAVSASFTIEQEGLPVMTPNDQESDWPFWNGDSPRRRLQALRERHQK